MAVSFVMHDLNAEIGTHNTFRVQVAKAVQIAKTAHDNDANEI